MPLTPSPYEPGYTLGTEEECAPLRAALLENTATILASAETATVNDPRLPLEKALTERAFPFLERQCYKLPGWKGEDGVHLTGTPKEGDTHGWVRVWYSPEVVAWLEQGRPEGQVPADAIIVKERYKPLGEAIDVGGVFKFVAWQPMIRRPADSRDGWFWGEVAQEEARHGEIQCSQPTLLWSTTSTLRMDDCRPTSGFGQPCIRCHASQADHTYSQLNHLPEYTGGEHIKSQTIYDYRRVWRDVDAENSAYEYDDYKNKPASTYIESHPDRNAMVYGLESANPEFVAQFGLPADEASPAVDIPRFFDHVVPKADDGAPDTFISSNQCWGCHSGVAHIGAHPKDHGSLGSMLTKAETPVDKDGMPVNTETWYADVSPWGEWSSSMMGLAGRDPVFRAQREWETDHRSGCADEITDLCYKCHGAAGQHQLHLDSANSLFKHEMVYALPGTPDGKYGALARDGITCTICHQMSDKDLGTPASYTGSFTPTAPDDLIGPFANDVRPEPMKRALGKKPSGEMGRDRVVKSSAMCGSCHAVKLPKRAVGSCQDDGEVYEQATFLEWRNSDYRKNDDFITDEGHDGATPQRCQDCHMPQQFAGDPLKKKIASIEDAQFPTANLEGVPNVHQDVDIIERTPFSRHQLNGINLFTLSMFAQVPRVFGVADFDYMSNQYGEPTRLQMANALAQGRALANETAAVEIGAPVINGTDLEFTVKVTNKAGHKLPSGVAFRRAFLEVSVEDASGALLWASGRTNDAGAIVDGNGSVLSTEFDKVTPESHHEVITTQDQVQIYEERVADSTGELTTSFLGIYASKKDNRLLPKGWKADFAPIKENGVMPEGIESHGVGADPEYPTDGSAACGCDIVTYRVPLAAIGGYKQVRARLHYQAIPPYYLRDRFTNAKRPDAQRLYQVTSHLNTDKDSIISGWKLQLTETTRATQ
ncbi:MAG TPA: hypothetical protein PK156_11055 [Polyangium sp.]|nr:hypothetical protein [Polyangium sp.]